MNLSDYNIYAQEVAILVNSNWGNVNSTCLVQVKLQGHIKDGIKDGIELPESDLDSDDTRMEPKWHYSQYKFEPENNNISNSEKEFLEVQMRSEDRIEEWKTPDTAEGIRQTEALWAKKDEWASKNLFLKEDAVVEKALLQRMLENERALGKERAKRVDEDNARAKAKNEALKKRLYG